MTENLILSYLNWLTKKIGYNLFVIEDTTFDLCQHQRGWPLLINYLLSGNLRGQHY